MDESSVSLEDAYIEQFDKEIERRIRFSREKPTTDSPVPLLKLEVEFDERPYLEQLAVNARRQGLITGYTISEVETFYVWKGQEVMKPIYVLQTKIPRGAYAVAKSAYDYFHSKIKEKWEVPLVSLDTISITSVLVNPEFAEWLEFVEEESSQRRTEYNYEEPQKTKETKQYRHGNYMWTYTHRFGNMNLWGSSGISTPEYKELRGILKNIDELEDEMEEETLYTSHLATVDATRTKKGILIPRKTIVYVLGDLNEEDFYNAVSDGKGLKKPDKVRIEEEPELVFRFVNRDFEYEDVVYPILEDYNARSLNRIIERLERHSAQIDREIKRYGVNAEDIEEF